MATCLVPNPNARNIKSIYLNGNATFEFESAIEVDDLHFGLVRRNDGRIRLSKAEIYADSKK